MEESGQRMPEHAALPGAAPRRRGCSAGDGGCERIVYKRSLSGSRWQTAAATNELEIEGRRDGVELA